MHKVTDSSTEKGKFSVAQNCGGSLLQVKESSDNNKERVSTGYDTWLG